MRKTLTRFCALSLTLVLLSALLCPVARAAQRRTVRVAYPIQAGLTEISPDGSYSGYTYEYLELISQYTGWDLVFVQAEGDEDQQLSTLMDQLTAGELDLMGGMLHSAALPAYSLSYGTVETILQALPFQYIPISEFSTLRAAVINPDGHRARELEDFCQMNSITVEYVPCESEVDQVLALTSGQADVLLTTSVHPVAGMYTVAAFAPKPFYFALAEGREDLLQELNQALIQISLSDPLLPAKLGQTYFSTASKSTPVFTDDEQAYIEASTPLRLGVQADTPPYFSQSDGGPATGILPGIAALLERKTGLTLELVPAASQDALLAMLESGEIDLISGLPDNYHYARINDVALTAPYLSAQYTLIIRPEVDDLQATGLRCAQAALSQYSGIPTENAVLLDSMTSCVEALVAEEADYAYVDAHTAQYYANLQEYWNLQHIASVYAPIAFCLGMRRPANQPLMGVLNKAIASITLREQQEIVAASTVPTPRLSPGYILRAYPGLPVAVLLLLLLASLVWYRQQSRSNRRLAAEIAKRNQLYALLDDHFFEFSHDSQILSVQNHLAPGEDFSMHPFDYAGRNPEGEPGEEFLKTIRTCGDGTFEFQDYCVDGQYHWLRVTQTVCLDAAGHRTSTIGKVQIVDAEHAERDKLMTCAQRDGLTGLYNAQTFRALAEEALSAMSGGQGALLLLDIDHFKRINDLHGHLEGDRALCWLAALLKELCEPAGITGRYGGDEFMIFFPHVESEDWLCRFCGDLCKTVAQRSNCSTGQLTISLGAVCVMGGDEYTNLFLAADQSLYQAKEAGRADYSVFSRDLSRPFLPSDLRAPCEMAELWLDNSAYQTILRESRMVAFEYDVDRHIQRVSPFINEFLAGNYDGRLLSDVMVQDGIIHPDDLSKSLLFRDVAVQGQTGEIWLRLLTPTGDYRWFRMLLISRDYQKHAQKIVGVLEDVDNQMRQQELLRRKAEQDNVTGIFNKETFTLRTQALLEQDGANTHYLLRFDVDRFKLINELFGSQTGNQVLCHLADALRRLARPGEIFGRLVNDVFCMCVSRSRTETEALARTIAGIMQDYPLSFRFFLPVGIVEIPPHCPDTVDVLCDRAALAQRQIKGNYLYQWRFYVPSLSDALNREHLLLSNMERALAENQFLIYLQPQVDMRDRRVVGAEALARWQHPELGLISPGEFMPLFERNGFVVQLDEYIWRGTCRTLRRWLDRGICPVPLSVNVSRVHLYDEGFCQKLIDLCAEYRISPALLELEITESAYTDRPQDLFPVMERLRQAGFIFAMDDFGSGYSSLNILRDIPVKIVKLDMQFLDHADDASQNGDVSRAGRTILRHTVQLMKNLSLAVLAEGVETSEQAQFLQDAGCFFAQGYYYARPIPLEEFERQMEHLPNQDYYAE